ncbi:MAG: OmpA family protein [Chitinophagaceae bacterium]|nr:OmpA family protein [Chitinophagaceae bacterium]
MLLFRHLAFLLFFSYSNSVHAGVANTEANPGQRNMLEPVANKQSPPDNKDTIVIRFEYKQSALYHKYTLETLDSVIKILLKDTLITLAIDGYAYKDEGDDNICYYLSLNRALFIQTYVLGRGVALTRISNIKAWGRTRQQYRNKDANGLWVNCRAELRLVYPPPPKKIEFLDRDEDGVEDSEDKCPDVFGISEKEGCPEEPDIFVPFALQDNGLTPKTYYVLDSVVSVLKKDPTATVSIGGHANLAEGAYSFCQQLATGRAEIVKLYLISRQINPSRIIAVQSYGISRPVNPAKNPQQVLANARAEIKIIKN